MTIIRNSLAVMLSGVATGTLVAPAVAQNQAPAAQAADRTARRQFSIPAGPLAAALNSWSRQSGRSIIFQPDDLGNLRTAGVKGRMSSEAALNALLDGSGLQRYDDSSGSVAIMVPAQTTDNGNNATPDILVSGRRSWSLNTGVQRSQDDSQPFIVMTREEIQRSGAPNLETFLRDRLNVNAAPGVSEQAKPGELARTSSSRGLSSINLRGIGVRDTLILIDGRRQPGVNIGDGTITQASITGIPLASIERIEVLASSASGIYGSGASGGVINIVLKRDFAGGEISANYADTADFAQGQGQLDVTYGMPIEGGRTRLSASGSWQKSRPMLLRDRADFRQSAIDRILANDPGALISPFAPPPSGTTPNFASANGRELTLKPQFGGGSLGSTAGTIPDGYRGVALDGLPPLIANIGKYNYEPADTAINSGLRSPMLYGSERMSGTLSARRTFNGWLTGYVGVTLSKSSSVDIRSRGLTYVQLAADAPNNPFQQSLQVALPGVGGEASVRNEQRSTNLIGGAIMQLPGGWQGAIDLSYSRMRFQSDNVPAAVTQASTMALSNGLQDVLRDITANPLAITYDNVPFFTSSTPGYSSALSPSLRVAGPLPLSLPGGRPQMTLNVEYSSERIGSVFQTRNADDFSTLSLIPSGRQQTRSVYGEISLPLIGATNHVPLFRELELRFSARWESYKGDGADPVLCDFRSGSQPAGDPSAGCPAVGTTINRSTTRNSRYDPSVSVRWTVFKPLVLRGSYTTGYLPPTLAQLVPLSIDNGLIFLRDPLRGYEPIGKPTPFGGSFIPLLGGGNPDVLPESSSTISVGGIFTPAIVPGLRLSADWTRIRKKNVYFDPLLFAFPGPASQSGFDLFLSANPDRVTRGPASDGFAAGPITSLDLSLVNLVGLNSEAVDFVLDYHHELFGGTFDVVSRATFVKTIAVEAFPGLPPVDYAGVISTGFASAAVGSGSLRWRGSAALNWTRDALTLGWQGRYFDRYALNTDRTIVAGLASAYVPSQFYQDINVSYRFNFDATLRFGINNFLNKKPPLDTTAFPLYYSAFGDPRLRNFYLGISKSF